MVIAYSKLLFSADCGDIAAKIEELCSIAAEGHFPIILNRTVQLMEAFACNPFFVMETFPPSCSNGIRFGSSLQILFITSLIPIPYISNSCQLHQQFSSSLTSVIPIIYTSVILITYINNSHHLHQQETKLHLWLIQIKVNVHQNKYNSFF